MSLEAIGSHWLHPDRELHGRKSCALELVYLHGAEGGDFDPEGLKGRAQVARSKGADVWVRVDWRPHFVLPAVGDEDGVMDYIQCLQQIVAENDIRGVICGNEVNLHDETQGVDLPPDWVARVVYGRGLPTSRTDCVYQFAKTVRPTIQVLAPPVAPWAAAPNAATGDRSALRPPDGRQEVADWEAYQYDLARCCYDHGGHVPDPAEIQFAVHTYGRVGRSGADNGGLREPWTDVRITDPGWFGAQAGSRWLQDAIYFIRQGMLNSPYRTDAWPSILISEANTLTEGNEPEVNYPTGWWKELASYADTFPNVMGLCAFVDQGLSDEWLPTSMSVPEGNLIFWNRDHDDLLKNGWAAPAAVTV